MKIRFTKHQVPRGTRADAERNDALLLVKNASALRLTYQIRLLTFRAIELRKKLVIEVPKHCTIWPSLNEFQREHSHVIRIQRF